MSKEAVCLVQFFVRKEAACLVRCYVRKEAACLVRLIAKDSRLPGSMQSAEGQLAFELSERVCQAGGVLLVLFISQFSCFFRFF